MIWDRQPENLINNESVEQSSQILIGSSVALGVLATFLLWTNERVNIVWFELVIWLINYSILSASNMILYKFWNPFDISTICK